MEQKVVKFLDFQPIAAKEAAKSTKPKGSLKCTIKERPARVDHPAQADHDVGF